MKERTYSKSHFLIITLTLTLFISTSKHIYDSLVTANTWDKRTHPQNSTLHTAHGRILKGDIEPETQQRYKALKERIIDLLDEDDESFRDRLNALTHDGIFREEYDELMSEYTLEKLSNALKRYDDFEKRVNPFKNNKRKKTPRSVSNNNELDNQYDEFKYYYDGYEGTDRAFYYVNDFRRRQRAKRHNYRQAFRRKSKVKKDKRPRIFKYLNTAISKIKAKRPISHVASYDDNEYALKPNIKNRRTRYHLENLKFQLSLFSVKLLKAILIVLYYTTNEVIGLLFP
ncbi:Plasmodium exported protein, unknown function [Plasmodium knowlesi strain H]|uniref:Pv-fam-d protein n=3 Tax=Plasmodium knowlesi TaxID=5850 RepID=A0A5E7X2B7_PLAKH|nr:Plasmodium exported protein, unknown function [Plasmodium knowlesi strain H]OTN65917.1 Uncharacterized protein PKNOH_S100070100 [Plasmodium knowlesi]CAA9988050.1 Plasmodium exported protein, unknown function [Plasmodium knowlesi strain H]SBO21947.1 Plasmodium exported protein, unknown function [Plasmodium knowlesi strain H]SBO29505.1 Plasmodium exported protein, unknown function [Plasmodium knowlesi strain H]VVS77524.1 Plasmodium exported protein, unknown function [Plasmodium knowlesi strai